MKPYSEDTRPEIHVMQREMLRRLSPAQKLAMLGELNKTVITLAISGLKSRFPDDPPEKIRRRLGDLLLGPELAANFFSQVDHKDSDAS